MTRRSTRLLAAAVGVAPAALVAQATTGVITGRVTDRASGAPIAAAQIQVVGTQRGTTTGDNGNFRIPGVPAGSVQLRVLRIGFAAQTVPVTVVGGQTASPVNVGLSASAVNLDVVTVTATGTTSRAREQGSNIATVSVQDQPLGAVQNFSQLVAGRAAGVTVVQSSGTTGTGARVRIRGANSLNQSNEPLLIIDGVRIDPSANSGTIGVGGQTISRLNDLKPEDIETFDILKGPAATGLYGTQAANGVIQVTTRRGAAGRPQFNGYGDLGTVNNYETYPGNYTVYGKAGPNATAFAPGATLAPGYNGVGLYSGNSRCYLTAQAAGTCTVDSITSVQPLNVSGVSPIVDGHRNRIGGSVRGGGEVARYFLSSDGETEHGVFTTSRLTRRNFRANVDATPIQGLNLGISAGYLSSLLQLPQGDNNILGLIPNGELGGPIICSARTPCITHNTAGVVTGMDTTSAGYYSGLLPSQLNQIQTYQNVNRFTSAFNGNYTPVKWLTFTGTAGADVNARDDQQLYPQGVINTSVNALLGNRTRNEFTVGTYTMNASAVANFHPFEALSSGTTFGVQYQRDNLNGTFASGVGLLPGTTSLAGTSQQAAVSEQNQYARTFGVLVQQQFGFRDRLFLTGSIRGDKNSAFGANLGFVTYPSGQLSYVPSEESWFPKNSLVNSVKLRAAYGQSGLRPGVFDALTYFQPAVASIATQNLGAFTTGNFGLSNLRPERINEAEGGFDLGLLGGKVSFEATYFGKASRDALVAVPLPGSAGGPASQLTNIGRVTNKGVELSSTINVVDQRNIAFSGVLNFSTLANKLVALRPGLGETVFGLGGNTQRFSPGYPLGGYFQPKYTYADTTGGKADGVIQTTDITISKNLTTAGQYIGNPLPKHTFSVQPTLTLLQNIRVQALIDYRGGFYLYNGTEQFRCVTTGVCPENFVTGSSLVDQAASIAARSGTVAGYITPAAFTKLRELSVNLGLPAGYAQRYLHVRGASLNLAGRNLHTWTGYKGVDPEVNFAGQSNFTQADFLTLPPVRYYIARINLDF